MFCRKYVCNFVKILFHVEYCVMCLSREYILCPGKRTVSCKYNFKVQNFLLQHHHLLFFHIYKTAKFWYNINYKRLSASLFGSHRHQPYVCKGTDLFYMHKLKLIEKCFCNLYVYQCQFKNCWSACKLQELGSSSAESILHILIREV